MKLLVVPFILTFLCAVACKSNTAAAPAKSSSKKKSAAATAVIEGDPSSDGEEECDDCEIPEGDEETSGSESGTGSGTASSGKSSSAGAVESLTIWSGTSGLASGSGYKIDGKAKTISTLSKAIIGSVKTGKAAAITEEQIDEIIAMATAAKDATPSKKVSDCASDKLLKEVYMSVTRGGVEEITQNAGTANCTAKRYISSASFQKILNFMDSTFAPASASTPSSSSSNSTP